MHALSLRTIPRNPFLLLTGFMLCGYLLMSRSFAHWGLRPFYVGELALAAFLFGRPSSILRPWLAGLMKPAVLSAFSWCLFLSLAYAGVQFLRVLLDGSFSMQVLEILAFHVYPLYFLAAVWIGIRHPDLISKYIVPVAWVHGIYGIAYISFLAVGIEFYEAPEFRPVGWFGHPEGAAILLLALLAYEKPVWQAAIPVIMNVVVMLGMQRRAEWVACVVAVAIWSLMAGRVKRVALFAALMMIPLLIGLLPGVKFPSPSIRGESLSTWDVLGRVLSVVDRSNAAKMTDKAEEFGDTATWRSDFWRGIWGYVNSSPELAGFGVGYGFPLWTLHVDDLTDAPVRTPHCIFMFVLAYSGWLGVLIWVALQLSMGWLLWKSYRLTGQSFGFCLWVMSIVWALCDPVLETPFGAIPLYMLMGLSVAPLVAAERARIANRLAKRSATPVANRPQFTPQTNPSWS